MNHVDVIGKSVFLLFLILTASVIGSITIEYNNSCNASQKIENEIKNDFCAENASFKYFFDGKHRMFRRKCWRLIEKSEWEKYAKIDGDIVELVVGINTPRKRNYADLKTFVEGVGGKIKNEITFGNEARAVTISIPFDLIPEVIDKLSHSKFSSYVEPNIKFNADFIPNDPYWSQQWALRKIEADYAWNLTTGSHSVLVAVIDSGIDYTHPDLEDNYVPLGYDWVNDDDDPMDDHGHGTHCAGIIAAVINNSLGIAGIAQVRVMAEKGLNAEGWGYEDDLAQCIIHAVDQGADILSCSWGSDYPSALIEDAIRYATSHGVLVIASAGNTATSQEHYPAAYEEVIAVTATSDNDSPAGFTTYGDWVEVSAPGVGIISTVIGGYAEKSGTSMSCPHVAGVAALILSLHPDFTRDRLRQAIRYATDDLGDVGFDVYYGYGRLNARKGVEELPLECDLVLWNWSMPPYVEPGSVGLINATIYNFGQSDVTNITVQLIANGSLVDVQTIDSLTSDSFTTITMMWTPEVKGLYNLTFYVVPVSGENDTRFNVAFDFIDVDFVRKIVVVDGPGTDYPYTTYEVWDRLNKEWRRFGDQMIYIDYKSLNKYNITYGDIQATGADVLLLSSGDYREYTDEEIEAITRYIYEGHGLIGTFWICNPHNSPNNRELLPLFGLSKFVDLNITDNLGIMDVLDPTHPLFTNVPTSMNLSDVLGCVPKDDCWDTNDLWGGSYLALEATGRSAIVTYRGLVYISANLEHTAEAGAVPPPKDSYLQLLYNAMVWSKFQRPEHELIASVKAPGFSVPKERIKINATVSNIGLNDEANITIQVIINGSIAYSYVIPSLSANSTYTLVYPWKPTEAGIYNVTIYVEPVVGEDNVWNNEDSMSIVVMVPPDVLVVADNDEYENIEQNRRTSLPEFISSLEACECEYYVWEEKIKGSPPLDFLKQFKLIIWTCGSAGEYVQITNVDASKLISYVKEGGKVLLDGDWISWSHYEDIDFIQYVLHATLHSMTWPWLGGTEGIRVARKTHLVAWGLPEKITWDIPLWIAISIKPAYGGFTIFKYIDNPEPPEYDLPKMPQVINWKAVVASEENREGSTLYFAFPFYGLPESVRIRIIKNALNWFLPREHELSVTLSTFKENSLEANRPVWLNSTVGNWGLNNETNVELQLLINGTVIDSEVIPSILVGSSHVHSYLWTPEKPGIYNITVQISPVSGEKVVDDNVMSVIVKVSRVVVALISDRKQLEVITSILDSMKVGYHIYSYNKYYKYTQSLSILSDYRVIIFAKTARMISSAEHATLKSYLASGGSLLVTDKALLYETCKVDTFMTDIVCAVCYGLCVIRDRKLYVVNGSHPIMDGPYGTYPSGCIISLPEVHCENATANITRNAITVAKWVSSTFPADKIIATELNPGRVAYWSGKGYEDWTESMDCQAIFKNLIRWLELGEFHDLKASVELPSLLEPGKTVVIKAGVHNIGYHNEFDVGVYLMINGTKVLSSSIPYLAKRTSQTVEYEWAPPHKGIYNITVSISLKQEEINATNNVYSVLVDVRYWPHIVLSAPENPQVNQTFSVNITVLNATDLCGWELKLYYRNYVLNATSVIEGEFLSSVGPTAFEILCFKDIYNATHGCIHLACSLLDSPQGVNGSGVLATIMFKGKATGLCNLSLCETKLITTTTPSFPHFYESKILTVGLLGDLNNDGIVDIIDVLVVTTVYGSRLGDPNWNPQADVVPDNVINIFDVIMVAVNYGKTRNP